LAYTTCFFWVKFFAFWLAISAISSLLNLFWPQLFAFNIFFAGIICSPILFANQIYYGVRKTKGASVNVSQISNKQWLHENIAKVTPPYQNQFVAVFNGEIIDSHMNLAMLRARIQEQGSKLRNVYIEFIKPKEEADGYEKLV
jgi:hypothetical protein